MECSCKLLLTAVLLCILIHGISSFTNGVRDPGPNRLFCRYFRGMFHPLSQQFNEDSVSIDTYFTKLTINKTFQDEPIAANCYESGELYYLTFNSSLQIKGLLLTAIREHGRLDHDNDIMGELLPLDYYWLKPNHLKKSVCANSVSHSELIDSPIVNIPWKAPDDPEHNAIFVYILVFSYSEFTKYPKHVMFPKCKKPVPTSMEPDSPSVNITSIKPDSPSVNTTSIKPDSPSVNVTNIPSTKSD